MSTPLHIFKAGKHTDMNGTVIEFTADDLDRAAKAYDPAIYEAPLVVGHPKMNEPAYGWVRSLSYADTLQATPDQVDPQFAELVNAGRFKKISASFYMPDAPNNPVPGVWYLRHVGFLGAAAPAVKGLKPASFKADEQGVVEFVDGYAMSVIGRLFRRMRDAWIAKFGLDAADSVLSDWDIKSIEDAARTEVAEEVGSVPAYREPNPPLPGEDAMTQAKVAELQTALDAANKTIAAGAAQKRRADAAAFCEELVRDGKVLPVHVPGLVALMASLPEGATLEFGETGKEVKQPPFDFLKAFLDALPKQVHFGESAPRRPEAPAVDFAAPADAVVDPAGLELHNKAVAYQRQHQGVSYVEAIKAVGGK